MWWEQLEEALDELETTVEYDGYFYKIQDAIIILIIGTLCELKNIKRIHEWAETEHIKKFLYEQFKIKKIPCYWWLLSLARIIKPESLNQCMKKWVMSVAPHLIEQIEEEENKKSKKQKTQTTIAIDGKEIRSTEKMEKYENPIHIVSAQIGELGITLAQEVVEGKSNEIPAAQKLIKSLEIRDCMVVADALNCQIDTAKAVLEQKADYLFSAKDNQANLKKDIEEYVQDKKLRSTMDFFKSKNVGHGRIETREAYTTDDVSWQPGGREWPGLKCIGAVHTHFKSKKKTTDEWHYYISSRNLTAEQLLHHARTEWSVETMHWLLDVHFREDECRIQDKNAQTNMNMLRKLALNVVRIYKRTTNSKSAMNAIMFQCLMNPALIPKLFAKN